MFSKDTKITFTVTGVADGRGNVVIGCKTFTESEINEVARDTVVETAPEFRPGDVIKIVSKSGTGESHGRVYVRGTERWINAASNGLNTTDEWISRALTGDNTQYTVEFLARAGRAV